MALEADCDSARNVAVHDRIARKYDSRHGEILNDFTLVRTGTEPPHALDFGSGSGNLAIICSRHHCANTKAIIFPKCAA